MSLDHLRAEARDLATLSVSERLARLKVDRWIGYTRANEALARLDELITHEPGKVRPRNLLIIGPTNNGKTMIAEKFRRTHPARISDDGEREVIAVVMVQMPALNTPQFDWVRSRLPRKSQPVPPIFQPATVRPSPSSAARAAIWMR